MEDNRSSLSPHIRLYNELYDTVAPEQRDLLFSLLNSAVASNTTNDEEIARQQQEMDYAENSMDVDQYKVEGATALDADAAFAFRLQQEEYAGENTPPFAAFAQGFDNEPPMLSDAELAAHLQAEENQKRHKFNRRTTVPSQRRMTLPRDNQLSRFDEPETIPMPNFIRTAPRGNNLRNQNDFSSLFRILASHNSGHGNIQNTDQDFGPNDYEHLIELDNSVRRQPLTRSQLDMLPTEQCRRSANKNDEENKCSICMETFEQNETLRRLPCLHVYHKDCIDNWLKTNNLCPICRLPPIK